MMIAERIFLSKLIKMFLRRTVNAGYLKVMEHVKNIIRIMIGGILMALVSMRFLEIKLSFMILMEILTGLLM